MRKVFKSVLSLIMSLSLLASVATVTNVVAAQSYPTDYPNTHSNTGNQLEDMVEVAYTQVGYKEAGNDLTKYNEWMSGVTGYNYQGVAWCATFLAWCANEAQIPTNIVPRQAGVTAFYKSYSESQIHTKDSGYTPKRGDICFFAYSDSTSPDALAHIGVVYGINGSNIRIIEGNCSAKVSLLERPFFGYTYGQYIVAYATPAYANSNTPSEIKVTGVTLSDSALSLKEGESASLTAAVTPSNATNKTIKFTSSDASVVKVDDNGKVTALKAGEATITAVSSNMVKAECKVTVSKNDAKLVSIQITSLPTKTVYYLWETFSADGMKVIATYSDSTKADVTSKCTVSGVSTLSVGEKTVTVKYTEESVSKSASFKIIVKAKLKALAVSSKPTKVKYNILESFDPSGMQIIAMYSDSTIKTVTNECILSGFSSEKAGKKTVKVEYTEDSITVSTSFSVDVVEKTAVLNSIQIQNLPNKTSYYQGETFSPDGIKVIANYSDSSKNDVTVLCTYTGAGTSAVGTKTVTVKYEEGGCVAKATFEINVFAKLKSLAVTCMPNKTLYGIGDRFDSEGIVVTATYSDNSVKNVQQMCTYTGFKSDTYGEKTVVITYTENSVTVSTKITVTVGKNNTLERIVVSSEPNKKEYKIGESFDITGLKITAYYSGGTSKIVTSECSFSGFDSSKASDNNVITVKYVNGSKTFTTSFGVVIKDAQRSVTRIKVQSHSFCVRLGQSAYNKNLKVLAYYDDGTTEDVTKFINLDFDSSKIGIKKATAVYTDEQGREFIKSFLVLVLWF